MNRALRKALEAVEAQHGEGPLTARLESAIDEPLSEVIDALAGELGGLKRSAAARALLRRGALGLLADERARA